MIALAWFVLVALVFGWPNQWVVSPTDVTVEFWAKLPPGDWHHYAEVRAGGRVRLYIDGVLSDWSL